MDGRHLMNVWRCRSFAYLQRCFRQCSIRQIMITGCSRRMIKIKTLPVQIISSYSTIFTQPTIQIKFICFQLYNFSTYHRYFESKARLSKNIFFWNLTVFKISWHVEDARMPSLSSFFPRERPGVGLGTMNALIPYRQNWENNVIIGPIYNSWVHFGKLSWIHFQSNNNVRIFLDYIL